METPPFPANPSPRPPAGQRGGPRWEVRAAEEGVEGGDTASKAYLLIITHRIPRTAVIKIASSSMGLSSDVGLRTLPAILAPARRQVNAERRVTPERDAAEEGSEEDLSGLLFEHHHFLV